MFRGIRSRIISAAATVAAVACLTPAWAAEVTLRMRGGTFEVKGSLQSHNSKSYILAVPGIGNLTLDAARYECIGPNCPPAGASAPVPPLPAGGAPLMTTWIGGSAVGTEVMPRLVRAYAASIGATTKMAVGSDPRNLEFKILSSDGRLIAQVNAYRLGVTPGFLALAKKEADLVWTGRRIVPEEQQMMAAVGFGNMRAPGNEHVWALDGLVVLVAKENPVEALTLEQLSKIFAGEITDWSELGLAPGRIHVYAPVAEAPAWSQFETDVMNPFGRTITPAAKRLIHSTEWADRVAEDPQGIVVSVFAMVRRAKTINITTSCGIIVQPTVFNIKTEEYPLSRRMFFYTTGEPKNPLARSLLAFALSPQLQPIVREARFVDQEPSVLAFESQTARIAAAINAAQREADANLMRRLVRDLETSQRVSFTFRFSSGTNTLDNRALEDVRRLRAMLKRPDMQGKVAILAGFSDGVGGFVKNVQLASHRVTAVRDALRQLDRGGPGPTIQEQSYGPLAPVACNDTEAGRALNRRVEVWLR
jgi:phosphate transport system substrate-binding protein